MIALRRNFLKRSVALLAGGGLTQFAMAQPTKNPPLAHNVYFWMNNPDNAEEAAKLASGIKSLADVKMVKGFRLGKPAATAARDVVDNSYSYHLMLLFDNARDQDAYQTDPIHEKFVKECSGLWKEVKVYDSDSSSV